MKLRFLLLFLPIFLMAEKVTLALDYLPNPNHVPIYAGMAKGYFEEEGLEIELVRMIDKPQTMTLLETRKADIALYCLIPTLRAAGRFNDFKIVGTYIDHPLLSFTVRERSQIKEPRDFAGKIIGARPNGTIGAILDNFSSIEKITYKEVKKIHFDMPIALALDKVDVVTDGLWNVEPFMLEAAGLKVRTFPCTDLHVPRYSELVFLMHIETLKDKPRLRKTFLKALSKSIRFAKEHPEEAFKLYAASLPNKGKKTLVWEKSSFDASKELFAEDTSVREEEVKDLHKWLSDRDLLKDYYPIQKLLP